MFNIILFPCLTSLPMLLKPYKRFLSILVKQIRQNNNNNISLINYLDKKLIGDLRA